MSVPTNEALQDCLWCDLAGDLFDGPSAGPPGASPSTLPSGASSGPSGASPGAFPSGASSGASDGARARGVAGGRAGGIGPAAGVSGPAAGGSGSAAGESGSANEGSGGGAGGTAAGERSGGASGVGAGGGGAAVAGPNGVEGTAFVVFRGASGYPGAGEIVGAGEAVAHANGMGLTLVPRRHVTTLVELPPPEMADVLAGLTRATAAMRELSGVERVEIRTDMDGAADGQGHVCFRVEPVLVLAGAAADDGSVVDVDAGTDADLRQQEGQGVAGARSFEQVASPRKP